jgi:hypothetical protein
MMKSSPKLALGIGPRNQQPATKRGGLTSVAALKEESMKRVAAAAFDSIQQDQERRIAACKELIRFVAGGSYLDILCNGEYTPLHILRNYLVSLRSNERMR